MINVGGKAGKVDLTLPDGKACVLFNEGEIIHASFGALQGREALFALFSRQNGRFTYAGELSEAEKALPILGGFMGLIMEGLQLLDESCAEVEPTVCSL